MPLIILCGYPCSGKTDTANKVLKYFENKGHKCVLVSDEEHLQNHERNKLYSESAKEKEVRGSLKSAAIRHLNSDTLVILDSGNYIKGFRYELYCLSKEHKTTHCIIECSVSNEELQRRNADNRYSEETIRALMMRYEAPDSRTRWDSPMFLVHDDTIPFEDIDNALFKRAAPPPNLATQSQPLANTSYLHLLDNKTREVINFISKAQQNGLVSDMTIPDSKVKLSLSTELTTAQLNKIRRQFLTYTKMHPVGSEAQIITTFVQYLNSNLHE